MNKIQLYQYMNASTADTKYVPKKFVDLQLSLETSRHVVLTSHVGYSMYGGRRG